MLGRKTLSRLTTTLSQHTEQIGVSTPAGPKAAAELCGERRGKIDIKIARKA